MGTDQQQFCLRWHSYQSSLMATLPQLLDGNHLTDVTLSAQGRNLRAHKVILSACSQYFKELFKELQPLQHPVIVLPGMNFSDLVALVTFMYSGEVNIYQHQLSGLLTMADVLHIRGLSEVGSEAGNAGMDSLAPPPATNRRDPKSPTAAKRMKLTASSSPTQVTSPPLDLDQSSDKRSKESALDYALYGKRSWTQAMDPNLYTNGTLSQEMAENLATMDSKMNANPFAPEKMTDLFNQKVGAKKNMERSRNFIDEQVLAAVGQKSSSNTLAGIHMGVDGFLRVKTEQELVGSAATAGEGSKGSSSAGKYVMEKEPDEWKGLDSSPRFFTENMIIDEKLDLSSVQGLDLTQNVGGSNSSNSSNNTTNNSPSSKCANVSGTAPAKLYATCFVCGKQLSNQYNLRVHMETHQNVQYACSICSHVSRSKDALRKHVSYRHPAPVDGSSGTGTSSATNKREGRKKTDQTATLAAAAVAAAAANASTTAAAALATTSAALATTSAALATTSATTSATSTSTTSTSTTSTSTTLANSSTAASSVTTSTNTVTSSDNL